MTPSSADDGKGMLASLGGTLKDSAAVQQLGDQAKNYLQAKGKDLLSSATERLEDTAGNGGFFAKAGVEGAKKVAEGESPAKAALGGVMSGAKDKVKSMFGGGKGGSQKAMHIIEDLDIGVPLSVAYDQWTQFQEFSTFMKGVESVDMRDEIESTWKFKVFKSRRTNTATISEQIPDRRIAWNTEGAKGTCKGVVTFHRLGENLTKVLLVLEYYPSGFVEKTGNIWRAAGRRARLDLKNFRDFVTIQGEATSSWRGEIRDSEVVREPEEVEADEAGDDDSDDSDGYRPDEDYDGDMDDSDYEDPEEYEDGEYTDEDEYEDDDEDDDDEYEDDAEADDEDEEDEAYEEDDDEAEDDEEGDEPEPAERPRRRSRRPARAGR